MKKICISLIYIFTMSVSFAQPAIEWQKCFGGTGTEVPYSIIQTTDGGYLVTGYTGSSDGDVSINNGLFDYWVVKLDTDGYIEWEKSYGGSEIDISHSVIQTSNGDYMIAGYTYSNNGDVTNNHGMFTTDFWIINLDINGNLLWQETYGGSMFEFAYEIIETNDGGFLVAGASNSNDGDLTGNYGYTDVWIIKLDINGSLLWQKNLGGSHADGAYSVKQTTDHGFIIAGFTESQNHDVANNYGHYDYWIVKTDSLGNLQWEKNFGGSMTDMATSIELTMDGGYIVAGHTSSNNFDVTNHNGFKDYWIIKLDSVGTLHWQKSYGGTNFDEATTISITNDGGYIVAGRAKSNNGDVTVNNGDFDYWIIKLDSMGNKQWQKSFGGTGSDDAHCIKQTNDNGYIIAGMNQFNNGDVVCNNQINFWILKLDAVVGVEESDNQKEFEIYPNPANSTINLKGFSKNSFYSYSIYSFDGKLCQSGKLIDEINIEELIQGIYFLKIEDENYKYYFKFIKK